MESPTPPKKVTTKEELDAARKEFREALVDPACVKRLKQCATPKTAKRVESDLRRIVDATPANGTKIPHVNGKNGTAL